MPTARVLALVAVALLPASGEPQPVKGSYVYTLSNFTGSIRTDFSRVAVDRERNEVYTLYQNEVLIFNDTGMEVYHFGDDLALGHVLDVAIDEQGDVLLLAYRKPGSVIVRCDYRGRPQSEIVLKDLPPGFSEFVPNRMAYRAGTFYLASTMGLQVVTADREGNVTGAHDLFKIFELEEKDRGNVEVGGFSVDREGNVLMTVPVLFRAYVLAPDGSLASFGKPGSAPGRFNIPAGIARDSRGNYLVVDRLKASILVFDRSFNFVTQFATRGYRSDELIFPDDLVVAGGDRVYVTQKGRKGISVFMLTHTPGTEG